MMRKLFEVTVKIKIKGEDGIDVMESVENALSFRSDFWDLIDDIDYSVTGAEE